MRFYLAARFSRAEELRSYAKELEELGHEVTSRWLYSHKKDEADGPYTDAERRVFATEDVADVILADTLVAFTEDSKANTFRAGRGGRHVELGIAIGLGKRVYVVGPRENVFCHLATIEVYQDFKTLKAYLAAL